MTLQIKLIIAGAILLTGLFLGYSYEKAQFNAYISQVETEAKVAEAVNNAKELKQKEISNNVTKGYADAVKKLTTHYTSHRVYNPKASGGEVSNNATTSTGVNAETQSIVPPTRGNSIEREFDELASSCASDVLQLLYLQQWIKEVQ